MVVCTERRAGLGRAEGAGALRGAIPVGSNMTGRHDGSCRGPRRAVGGLEFWVMVSKANTRAGGRRIEAKRTVSTDESTVLCK
jgi:hypothetical protein